MTDEWQPISTVPRDGRDVLLWWRDPLAPACAAAKGRKAVTDHIPDISTMAARQAAYAAARREWWAMIERVLEVRLRELQERQHD